MNNYYDKKVRELCHGVKDRDQVAIKEMADYFLNLEVVNAGSVLIPAPQHEGYAIYTKQIADIIAEQAMCQVADVLISEPRELLYKAKLDGTYTPLDFTLSGTVSGKELYFIDNVIDTGTTFSAANRLFEGRLKPMIYAAVR